MQAAALVILLQQTFFLTNSITIETLFGVPTESFFLLTRWSSFLAYTGSVTSSDAVEAPDFFFLVGSSFFVGHFWFVLTLRSSDCACKLALMSTEILLSERLYSIKVIRSSLLQEDGQMLGTRFYELFFYDEAAQAIM